VLKKGPDDGSAPIAAAKEERSVELRVLRASLRSGGAAPECCGLRPPTRGLRRSSDANNAKWREALLPLLVGKDAAKAVSGGGAWCSGDCLNEEDGRLQIRGEGSV